MKLPLPNPSTGVQDTASPAPKWRWWDQVDRNPAEARATVRECRRIGDQLAKDHLWPNRAGAGLAYRLRSALWGFTRSLRAPGSAIKQELIRRKDPRPPRTELGFLRKVTAHTVVMLRHGFSSRDCETFGVGTPANPFGPGLAFTRALGRDLLHHLNDIAPPAAAEDYRLLRNKVAFAGRGTSARLPIIPILAAFKDGRTDPASLAQGDVSLPDGNLFLKLTNKWCGEGAEVWRLVTPGKWVSPGGESLDKEGVACRLRWKSQGTELLVQPQLKNVRQLAASGSGALCTVRLATCLHPDGHCELLPPVLRLGSGNGIVDNLQGGGMAAPLNPLTGQICGPAVRFRAGGRVERLEVHPDSGVALRSITVPEWETVVQTAVAAQGAFRHWPFVGWDIAVTEAGVVLVEGNAVWGTEVTQLPTGVPLGLTGFPAAYLAWREAWLQTGRVQASR